LSYSTTVRAEDQQAINRYYYNNNNNNDPEEDNGPNENDNNEEYYWTITPPPTLYPTPGPTPQPTPHPTRQPTNRPTWSNEAFYEIDNDDGYTIQEQQAKIYFSSMSDVILCLMCTFFWVIWIVGTIFPTKIQHLYRTEGVVVRGYVVESFTSTANARVMEMEEVEGRGVGGVGGGGRGENEEDGLDGLDGMGVRHNGDDDNVQDEEDDDLRVDDPSSGLPKGGSSQEYMEDDSEGMNLPTYHAIVSYVVPGRVASGRRKRRMHPHSNNMGGSTFGHEIYSPSSRKREISMRHRPNISDHYILQKDDSKHSRQTMTRQQQQQQPQSIGNIYQQQGNTVANSSQSFFPKPPSSPSRLKKLESIPSSSDSVDAVVVNLDVHEEEQLVNPQKRLGNVTNRRKSLLDSHTFDSGNTDGGTLSKWKDNDKGYYKYNVYDDSDYESPMGGEDEYEDDPEYIGNLFYHFGWIKKPKKKLQPPEPVRVKKRFETNHLLEPGLDNVEIIVLPGNPGSGILKDDFEQEEDFKYGGSKDYRGSTSHMGDLSAGMIGVALAAVSVIGAVHGALTLPYTERICKYSLSLFGWIMVDVLVQLAQTSLADLTTMNFFLFFLVFVTQCRWLGGCHYKSNRHVASCHVYIQDGEQNTNLHVEQNH
jgi:hypothetical protein